MIRSYISRNEDKTLEFKENCRSIRKIVSSVVAFANTSGGNIVIGVRDKTKDIVGLNLCLSGIQTKLIPLRYKFKL